MAAVVRDTPQLPPRYREAIADYLKSLPTVAGEADSAKPNQAPWRRNPER